MRSGIGIEVDEVREESQRRYSEKYHEIEMERQRARDRARERERERKKNKVREGGNRKVLLPL